jgi:hypothetical protein
MIGIGSARGSGRKRALAVLLVLAAASASVAAADKSRLWTSESGLYRVGYTSELDPITINEIHAWTLHVETADGEPVANADIEISGGMPAHNHGLPTRPRVTEYLGRGDYRVEGMRFHMRGDWEISVTINARPGRDVCRIPLTL